MSDDSLSIELVANGTSHDLRCDPNRAIYELDKQIDMLESHADKLDYLVAACSGLLCGALDVLWVGDFDLARGREASSEAVDGFVTKIAQAAGYDGDDLTGAVRLLEKLAPIPSDASTPDFGGGLQHHLRDFAHHPTPAGLAFSLLTQFTGRVYGVSTADAFLVMDVPERALNLIGETVPEKLLFGTLRWFLHLVSDMAGSGSTAGLTGGTGIPGPLLSLAKELSATPLFRNISVGDVSLSEFLSKLFNGTLLAKRDASGRIIRDTQLRFDLRGELGALSELGRQAIPVIANECVVRGFYLMRHLASQISRVRPRALEDMQRISWEDVKPFGNPTIDRMLTISTGVFTSVDVAAAAASETWWLSVNYVGVCRFAVAVGKDVSWSLKARDLKRIRSAYEVIRANIYTKENNAVYDNMGEGLGLGKFGLTLRQTEILYNLERQKVFFDIRRLEGDVFEPVKEVKRDWLRRWSDIIREDFPEFVGDESAELHWYALSELKAAIEEEGASNPWFRLALLEAMLFEPYYLLDPEGDERSTLQKFGDAAGTRLPLTGYSEKACDEFLEETFAASFVGRGYIKRLRSRYSRVSKQLNESLKGTMIGLGVTALGVLALVATAGVASAPIATALVGSQFSGLSGAALASACLAYLGGGAIAAGGLGMMGGSAVIVGGAAILGAGIGGAAGATARELFLFDKRRTIAYSAKVLTAVEEIFLNDEHDLGLSQTVIQRYQDMVVEERAEIQRLKFAAEDAEKEEKKRLVDRQKAAEKSARAMEIAVSNLKRFSSSLEVGLETEKAMNDCEDKGNE